MLSVSQAMKWAVKYIPGWCCQAIQSGVKDTAWWCCP